MSVNRWTCSQCGKRVSTQAAHQKLRVPRGAGGWDHARCHERKRSNSNDSPKPPEDWQLMYYRLAADSMAEALTAHRTHGDTDQVRDMYRTAAELTHRAHTYEGAPR